MTTYNTMNPVPSADARDRYDNSQVFDELMNGAAPSTPDRLGVLRQSWKGMELAFSEFLINSGFEPVHLIYVDGQPLQVDRPTQLIDYDGSVYRIKMPSSFPVMLTGDWATDLPLLVDVGDVALREVLAMSSGAGMIGFRQRTVADRLNDTANVKDYGAIADGTLHPLSEFFGTLAEAQAVYPSAAALTDSIDSVAAQSALDSGTPRVHFPGGHYVFNKQNTRNTSVMIVGDGFSSYLDYGLFNGADGMLIQGQLTQINNLGAYVAKGASQLTFSGTPVLESGDVVILYNPTNGSWLSDRTVYRAGEYFRVHSMAANVASIYGESTDQYLVADVQVWQLKGIHVTIDGIRTNPANTAQYSPIKVLFGNGVRIKDYWGHANGTYTGLSVERSFDVNIAATTGLNNSDPVNNEYGVTIVNCQNVIFTGGSSAATRHAIALGGTDAPCCVPNRNILVYGAIFENADIPEDIGAGDMHGGADNITYDNCIFRRGVIMQGRNATVRNSIIYGVGSVDGSCIYGTEIKGGVYTIENNRFISRGVGASYGIVHLSPGPSMSERLTIVARDNTFELSGAAFNTKPYMFRGRGITQPMDLVVEGVTIIAGSAALFCFVYADDNVLTALNSDKIIVDNVSGPAGTPLLYPHADIASVPVRLMRQCGSVNVAVTATVTIAAPAQAIRYPYPKMPSAHVGVSSQAGGDQGIIGSVAPVPVVYTLTTSAIRPAIIASTGNFAVGTARLHWATEINEV